MKTHTHRFSKSFAGFSLVEIIAVCTIIGIFAGLMIFPLLGMIDNARKRAEREKLAKIADEIRATFTNDYLPDNISAMPDELPWNPTTLSPAMEPTTFDRGTPLTTLPDSTVDFWYWKLARLRGQSSASVAEGTDVHDIAINPWKGRRVLIAGPNENFLQRYILLSFMFPEENIPAIPTPGATGYEAWFNAIYDHDWGKPLAETPAGSDWGAWGAKSLRGERFAERVMVEKIVQRRYTITVNNSHTYERASPSDPLLKDSIYIYTNIKEGTVSDSLLVSSTLEPGLCYKFDGSEMIGAELIYAGNTANHEPTGHRKGILGGRRVRITRQAPGASDATHIYSILLNEDVTVVIQRPRREPDPLDP
jgi:type II secretory pathway pseudopilin PulG